MSDQQEISNVQSSEKSTGDDKTHKRSLQETEELDKKVHSANDWEHADLGDDHRRNKFLKLMGAGKKQHSGRFVIGDQSADNKRTASESLNRDLEKQYTHSMEHKITGVKRHMGLGFEKDDKKEQGTDKNGEKVSESDSEKDNPPQDNTFKDVETPADKDTKCSKETESSSEIKEKHAMTFVKSSS